MWRLSGCFVCIESALFTVFCIESAVWTVQGMYLNRESETRGDWGVRVSIDGRFVYRS